MEFDYLALITRWLHILPAMAAVGGTMFMRWGLLPSMGSLPEEQRATLHANLRARWAKVVMGSIGLLLASGIYNIVQKEQGWQVNGLYHALFGIKFLLAMAIFFVASALVGRSEAYAKMRENRRFWLTLNLVLAIVLVCISGALRGITLKAKQPRQPARSAQVTPADVERGGIILAPPRGLPML